MILPYWLFTVNAILSLIILLGILIFIRFFPKRKINLAFLLLIISLLPLVSMLRAGTYQSGDLSLHAVRSMSFFKILFTEHTIPLWTPEFYAGYGDPYFAFAYFVPYFGASVLHFVGLSFLFSIKLLMAVSYVLSGVFMYLFVKEEFGEKAGFTAGIFYLFLPAHLINMHFQVTVAQTITYLFLPLNFYLTRKLILRPNRKTFVTLSLSQAVFILSHQVISLAFFPFNIAYALFVLKTSKSKVKKILYFSFSLSLGLILSAFYWLPILGESKYTQQAHSTIQNLTFPNFQDMLFSAWRFGLLFQGHKGEISPIVGYTQIFIVILAFIILLRFKLKVNIRNNLFFFLIPALILFFLISPFSKTLWELIPFSNLFQFTTRLLVILGFFIAVLAGIAVMQINNKIFTFVLCSITIFYTILNWGNRTTIPTINDASLAIENRTWTALGSAKGLEPSSPVWANENKNLNKLERASDISTIAGFTGIKETFRTSKKHTYQIDVFSKSALLSENTLYFPGWTLKTDGKEQKINYEYKEYSGLMVFDLVNGSHLIDVSYVKTPVRKFSDLISELGVILLALYILIPFIPKLKFKPKS